ncbi:MAG: hypothetical protein V1908_04830 [Candidatus Peregrinibacteria bacterium]
MIPTTEKITVLCVDDEKAVLNALGRTLNPVGKEAEFDFRRLLVPTDAQTIEDVRAHIASLPAKAIIVTDRMMPGVSGVDVIREAKATGHPVALLTGTPPSETEKAQLRKDGLFPDALLTKPWNAVQLRMTLKRLFESVDRTT